MQKLLGLKEFVSITLLVMLIGGLVFFTGFGICLYIARTQVTDLTNRGVQRDLDVIHNYIDGQLETIEEIALALGWAESREYAIFNEKDFETEDEIFEFIENILIVHPNICGCAIGLESPERIQAQGQYGLAAYVTNVSGELDRLRLGAIHNYREKPWYKNAMSTGMPCWSLPFRETNMGKVVTCFSLPLKSESGKTVGVIALDIDTENFRQKCSEIMPFEGAVVTIVDRNYRFVSHPDSTYLLKDVMEYYADELSKDNKAITKNNDRGMIEVDRGDSKALFYFDKISRTNWTIGIECPVDEVYSSLKTMRHETTIIAIISMIFMLLCFIFIYNKMRNAMLTKASLESDMKIASDLQMSLLPHNNPPFPDNKEVDVFGFIKPAKTVGGDLFDYVIRGDKLFFSIGDVSGKGLPASLFMSIITIYCHSKSRYVDSASELMMSLNDILTAENSQNMFCTLFLGMLDLKTGVLQYCNAGHDAPIHITINDEGKREVVFLPTKCNIAVGVMEDFQYTEQEITLKPGDGIFLYTDGITEAENVDKELFGMDATIDTVRQIVKKSPDSPAESKVEDMYSAIKVHTDGNAQSDDITMVMVEYKGPANA